MNGFPLQFYPGRYNTNYGHIISEINGQENKNDLMAILSNNSNCTADDSVYWIYEIFGQCVLSNLEMLGFVLGMSSIACWMMSTIPQMVLNCRIGSADKSLSIYFLVFWLAGDTCNMFGCILASQLPIQIITGCYYILMDLVMIMQYWYLKKINQSSNREARLESQRNRERRDSTDSFLDEIGQEERQRVRNLGDAAPLLVLFVPFINLSTRAAQGPFHRPFDNSPYGDQTGLEGNLLSLFQGNRNQAIGYTLGLVSCIFYMVSRIPQIIMNFKRGTTDGISVHMFLLAILGNSLYGSSVLLARHASVPFWNYFKMHLPWLIGSFGTMSLDSIVICQCLFMKRLRGRRGYREVNGGNSDHTDELILRESD